VWIAIIIIIVVALVAGVCLKVRSDRREAEARRAREMAVISSQLGVVQSRVEKALGALDQPVPDVDRAAEALNGAAEGITAVAQNASAADAGVADKLVGLQGNLRTAAQGLQEDKTQYEQKVAAARDELKSSATQRVRPILESMKLVTSSIGGQPGQALVPSAPGTSASETGTASAPSTATPAPAAAPTPGPSSATPAAGTQ
jgi:hypothetical protein